MPSSLVSYYGMFLLYTLMEVTAGATDKFHDKFHVFLGYCWKLAFSRPDFFCMERFSFMNLSNLILILFLSIAELHWPQKKIFKVNEVFFTVSPAGLVPWLVSFWQFSWSTSLQHQNQTGIERLNAIFHCGSAFLSSVFGYHYFQDGGSSVECDLSIDVVRK